MDIPISVLISLEDPVGLLRESFREYTVESLKRRYGPAAILPSPPIYNCIPYMTMLIDEIVGDAGNPELFGQISPSTALLINDGLDKKTASKLTLDLFKLTTDAISSMIPDATFDNSAGYQFDFCGEDNLMVGLPMKQRSGL